MVTLHRVVPRFDAEAETISITLTAGGNGLPAGFRLAVTSDIQLEPPDGSGTVLTERIATYHELAADPPATLAAGERWEIADLALSHLPNHANDGPSSAFLILPDGTTETAEIEPVRRVGSPPLVPHPRHVDVSDARGGRPGLTLADHAPAAVAAAWQAVVALERRVRPELTVLDGGGSGRTVEVVEAAAMDDEAYRLEIGADRIVVEAAGPAGWRQAFVTLSRWADELPTEATVDDHPEYSWRGLHIDLARRWYEPDVVSWLIDVCAWRKLSRLHLHLTDDEAWRLPVAALPALGEIGGRRGHGLPIPPMVGDGAGPTGRAYTTDEIAGWVARADELGVVLVPEVDVPAHVHAALVAMPELRDPDERSQARSVQHFIDNVLVPGHPETAPFLEAVFDAVAELFPSSPWIHIGGDEVAAGAWSGSPIVAALRAEHGLDTTRDVEAHFHRGLVDLIRRHTGRRVGAWQEAAESGGVVPGDGYVVGWMTVESNRELAAAGHDVVVAPAQAYYLDMALDTDWTSPGASWAGSTSFEDVCEFEPEAGWSHAERSRLLGIQACLWSEHVDSPATMRHLLFPRLDAVAERAWTGRIEGGSESLLQRAL